MLGDKPHLRGDVNAPISGSGVPALAGEGIGLELERRRSE
jgi:hypothetical protein